MKTFITALLIFAGLEIMAQQMIIAHRGASYLAPENTVAAAKLAWELGADAVEVDVYLASDNQVVAIHDKDTKRVTGGKKSMDVKNTPSQVLRNLDVGSWKDKKYKGEKIPFLSEMINTVPAGKQLVVEIKAGKEIIPHLKRIIGQSGKEEQMIFIAFDWDTILETQKEFPNNKCYWLSSKKNDVDSKIKPAAKAGLAGINLHYNIIDKGVVEKAAAHNLEVLTWTVNDPAIGKQMTELGVKAITTDRPKWLKEEMAKR